MLVLALLLVVLNGITVAKASNISPLDEEMWIDHLIHGSELEIVHSGDRLSEESVYELCVRGGPTLGELHPPCDERPLRPADFRWHGVNLAGHTPFYFLVTGPIARVLRATPIDLPPSDSLATWARLLGTGWLLLGWYLVLRIGDLLRVHRRRLVVALLLLSATPALLQASTTVNPDQTAVPSGAAVLLAILLWERRGRGLLWVVLAAIAAAALDPTNTVAVVLGVAYVAFRAATTWRRAPDEEARPWTGYAAAGVVLVVAGWAGSRGWDWIGSWFSTPHPVPGIDLSTNPVSGVKVVGTDGLSFDQLFGTKTIFGIFPPFDDAPGFYTPRSTGAYLFFVELATFLSIGAMLVVALRNRIVERITSLDFALVTALIVTPSLFVLRNYWVGGSFGPTFARFGLAAIPAMAIVIAGAGRHQITRAAVLVVAVGLYVTALIAVL